MLYNIKDFLCITSINANTNPDVILSYSSHFDGKMTIVIGDNYMLYLEIKSNNQLFNLFDSKNSDIIYVSCDDLYQKYWRTGNVTIASIMHIMNYIQAKLYVRVSEKEIGNLVDIMKSIEKEIYYMDIINYKKKDSFEKNLYVTYKDKNLNDKSLAKAFFNIIFTKSNNFKNMYLTDSYIKKCAEKYFNSIGVTVAENLVTNNCDVHKISTFADKTHVDTSYDDIKYGKPYIKSFYAVDNLVPKSLVYLFENNVMGEISYDELESNYKYSNFYFMCIYDKFDRQYIYLNPNAVDSYWISFYDDIIEIVDKYYKSIKDDIIYVKPNGKYNEMVFVSTDFLVKHGFKNDMIELEKGQNKYTNSYSPEIFSTNLLTIQNTVHIIENAMIEEYRFTENHSVAVVNFKASINEYIEKYIGREFRTNYNKTFHDALKYIINSHDELGLGVDGGIYGDYEVIYGLISVEDAIEELLYNSQGYSKKYINSKLLK